MLIPSVGDTKIEVKSKDKKEDDFATTFQNQSLFIFPIMIGFFSFNFPIGLSLYWNTFTVFGIIQQYQVSGLGGLKDLINKYGKKFNK
jgi:YidC/Oxa1 family membrane protein insertase